MVNQMMECKRNVDAPLILQSYIMALMLHIVRDFHRVCETNHGVYIPFLGQEHYVVRDLSLMTLGVPRLDSSSISKCPFLLYLFCSKFTCGATVMSN